MSSAKRRVKRKIAMLVRMEQARIRVDRRHGWTASMRRVYLPHMSPLLHRLYRMGHIARVVTAIRDARLAEIGKWNAHVHHSLARAGWP